MRCPKCLKDDIEILNQSNVHSSWITGRTISNNNIKVVCKSCGRVFDLGKVRRFNLTPEERKKEDRKIIFITIAIILAAMFIAARLS